MYRIKDVEIAKNAGLKITELKRIIGMESRKSIEHLATTTLDEVIILRNFSNNGEKYITIALMEEYT